MANIASGELAVYFEGREYVFRPSFRALAEYGTADELAQVFERIQAVEYGANLVPLACAMLTVMCDEDITPIVGHWEERDGKLVRVPGRMSNTEIVILGIRAVSNGVVGDTSVSRRFKPPKEDKPASKTFEPAEFAAAAMVHFGLSRDDAWNMTMCEFQRALAIKFPDAVADLPSREEYKSTIDLVKHIREKAKNG